MIKTLNTIHVIIRPAKDSIFPHLARRLEKLPTPALDNLAQLADRLFDDERRAISQTDKLIFRSAATSVAGLSASLDHMRRDLQFLRNDISSLSWRGVDDTSTTGSPFCTDSPAHFDGKKITKFDFKPIS